jgi:hypothetical protein
VILRRETTLSVHIVRVEFNFSYYPNNAVCVSGFCGKDGGIVELNLMSLADTVFGYG